MTNEELQREMEIDAESIRPGDCSRGCGRKATTTRDNNGTIMHLCEADAYQWDKNFAD